MLASFIVTEASSLTDSNQEPQTQEQQTQEQQEAEVNSTSIEHRFRGYLPVVIDIETGGFNNQTDGLLELAMVTLQMNEDGILQPRTKIHFHVEPFEGANLCPKSLAFTGIDPFNPLRGAVSEREALDGCIAPIKAEMKENQCNRAIIVAHNAHFDHGFLKAAMARANIKRDPFHPFSSIDTASLAAVFFGQTVLAKACKAAGMEFSSKEAHSALYDATQTADLFCHMVNRYKTLGGYPH